MNNKRIILKKINLMKRNIYLSILRSAFAALLLAAAAACSDDTPNDDALPDDDSSNNTADLVTVRFGSGGDDVKPETRTSIDAEGKIVRWTTSDNIGISAVRTDNTDPNMKNVINKLYQPATATVNSTFTPADGAEMELDKGGTYTFYSYYPRKYDASEAKQVSVRLSYMTQTNGTSSEHIGKQDFMWAQQSDIQISDTEESPQVNFKYKHIFPMFVFKLQNAEGKEVKVISVRSADGTTPMRGSMDVSLTDGSTGEVTDGVNYMPLTFNDPMGADGTGRLLTLPHKGETKLIIGLLTTDNVVYEYEQTARYGLEGGLSYKFTFNLAEGDIPNRTVYTAAGKNDDWKIGDESGLRAYALAVNYYGQNRANATLTHDIILNTYTTWEEPIGMNKEISFYQGTFDGAGYTISGLNINRDSGAPYVGLFGYLYDGKVSNLHVTGSVSAKSSKYVGGIAGSVESSSSGIQNCLFEGTVKGKSYVGGIVGENNKGQITACFSSGSVSAENDNTGGIAGYNYGSNASITHCYSSATVTSTTGIAAGGIVGNNSSGKVSFCYATGAVSATDNAGGIAGNNKGTLEKCLALGSEVSCTDTDSNPNVGRVAGYKSSSASIINCRAWEGMKVNSVTIADSDGTSLNGANLTTAACKDKNTYTDGTDGFVETVWTYDMQAPWKYLPWNKELEKMWPTTSKTDHPARITVPAHLK